MNYEVNDHYWQRYLKFIRSRTATDGYVERHHIYPRSMFPQLADDPKNLIPLTAREHFLAHWMLHKAFGGKMTNAFMYMRTGSDERYWNLNSRAYERLRVAFGQLWSEIKTGVKRSAETRRKMSESRTGVPLSAEHRASIAAGNRGKAMTDERKRRISEGRKGITPNRPMTDSYMEMLRLPKQKVACQCCGVMVAPHLVDRWHNNNCKHRATSVNA